MNSSINFKKLVSVGAALLLALGGGLATATPAQAAALNYVESNSFEPSNGQTPRAGGTLSNRIGDTTNVQTPPFDNAAHSRPFNFTVVVHWFYCDTARSAVSIDSTDGTFANDFGTDCHVITQGTATNTSYVIDAAYVGKRIGVYTKASFNGEWLAMYSATTGVVQAAPVAPVVAAGSPPTSGLSDTGVTLNYSSNQVGNLAWAVRAASSAAPTGTYLGAWNWGVLDLKHGQGALMTSGAATVSVTGLTAGTDYVAYLIVAGQAGPSNVQTFTFTTTGGAGGGSNGAAQPLSPEQARNQIKPLPTIVQPIATALPQLNKPVIDAGGKVDLKSGDFTGLVSASISGKPLDITLGSTGSLTFTVPNGKAGTTADLLLNFKSGTVILQDAIKYVAPVVVANVPVRLVAIKSGAKKLSSAAADSVRLAAFANLANDSIECVAYASSAANADAAKATAQQACDLAVKANPNLVNVSVSVAIDKIKAATQGVGIKVYH